MYNKFKVKKKLVSMALALALATQPLATLPMNVFAGTGKNDVMMAPTIVSDFDIDKIIELANGEKFDVNNYVKNIKPQGANVSYTVESATVFSDDSSAKIFDDGKNIANSGIAKVKVTVGGVSKYTYIVADVGKILSAVSILAAQAASTSTSTSPLKLAAQLASTAVVLISVAQVVKDAQAAKDAKAFLASALTAFGTFKDASAIKAFLCSVSSALNSASSTMDAASEAVTSHNTSQSEEGMKISNCLSSVSQALEDISKHLSAESLTRAAQKLSKTLRDTSKDLSAEPFTLAAQKLSNVLNSTSCAFNVLKDNLVLMSVLQIAFETFKFDLFSGVLQFTSNAFKTMSSTFSANAASELVKTDYTIAKNACDLAKTALNKGLNLESQLKTAYMAYRVAEAVWTQLNDNSNNLKACKARADKLKEVIDACWPSN